MLETFAALLAAHLVADFVLQTDWVIARKRRWWGMALHIGCVGVTAALAVGRLDPVVLGVIVVTHLTMDMIKTFAMKDDLRAFLIDQAVHLAVIAVIAVTLPATASLGWWGELPAEQQRFYYVVLVGLSGFILAIPAGGIVIGKLMDPLAVHRQPLQASTGAPLQPDEGLPNGGQYIGWLERGLTVLLILNGQPEAVGLLLAAKSILRFSDINQTHLRRHTEYVILGTLLSFGWALVVAILTQAALRHWA